VIVLSAATAPATGRALSRLFADLWNSAELLIWRMSRNMPPTLNSMHTGNPTTERLPAVCSREPRKNLLAKVTEDDW